MALGGGWNIETFSEEFAAHNTPEVLVLVLTEALSALELQFRRGGTRNDCELKPAAVHIDPRGNVAITATGPSDPRGLLTLFMKFLPEEERVHPELRNLLARARTKAVHVWNLRALLLDYLTELGLDGAQFTLAKFLQDPKAYVHAARAAIVDRSCQRVRRLNRWGRRRRAVAELQFLLEISPVNRQVLDLWRDVKQGYTHLLFLIFSWALAFGVAVLSSSVIVEKLQLPIATGGPKRLVIEPMAPAGEPSASGVGRSPADAGELEEISRSTQPQPGMKRGAVELDFDPNTLTYFDGAPGSVPAHGSRETVWLREGPHEVTVVKPGQTPVMAHLSIQLDRVILLTDRNRSH